MRLENMPDSALRDCRRYGDGILVMGENVSDSAIDKCQWYGSGLAYIWWCSQSERGKSVLRLEMRRIQHSQSLDGKEMAYRWFRKPRRILLSENSQRYGIGGVAFHWWWSWLGVDTTLVEHLEMRRIQHSQSVDSMEISGHTGGWCCESSAWKNTSDSALEKYQSYGYGVAYRWWRYSLQGIVPQPCLHIQTMFLIYPL